MTYVFESVLNTENFLLKVYDPSSQHIIWEKDFPTFTEDILTGEMLEDSNFVELGIMKDGQDLTGLETWLKSNAIINEDDKLIKASDNNRTQALQKAITLIEAKKDNLPPLYSQLFSHGAESLIRFIAEQAVTPDYSESSKDDKTVIAQGSARKILESSLGSEIVELSLQAFPADPEYVQSQAVAAETFAIPDVTANQIAQIEVPKKLKSIEPDRQSQVIKMLADYLLEKANRMYLTVPSFKDSIIGDKGKANLRRFMSMWSDAWIRKNKKQLTLAPETPGQPFAEGGSIDPYMQLPELLAGDPQKDILLEVFTSKNIFLFYKGKMKNPTKGNPSMDAMLVDHITDFRDNPELAKMYEKTGGYFIIRAAFKKPIIAGWNDLNNAQSINQLGRHLLKDWQEIPAQHPKRIVLGQYTMGGAIDANIKEIQGYADGSEYFKDGGSVDNVKSVNHTISPDFFKKEGNRISKKIKSDNGYKLLDSDSKLKGSTWAAGGCYPFAQAMNKIFGGRIVAIENENGLMQHILLKVGNLYLDSDGVSSIDKKLSIQKEEDVVNPRLTTFDENKLGKIGVGDKDLVDKIIRFVKKGSSSFQNGGVTACEISYGDHVKINTTSDQTQSFSDAPLYREGQEGFVTGISHKDNKCLYEVSGGNLGMVPASGVPFEHLTLVGKEKKEQVEKILDDKQKTKKFKDIGSRVTGSKKERIAYSLITTADLSEIELDEITAIQLVVKDKVYPEVNIAEQRAAGVSSGACFLKVEIRKACGSKPPNGKAKRSSYVQFISTLTKGLESLKTVEQVVDYLYSWDKISIVDLVKYFFDLPGLSEINQADAELKFKERFRGSSPGYIFAKVVEEIFGKRFENFIFFKSDPAKITRQKAKDYEGISAPQATQNEGDYVDKKLRYAEANKAKAEEYKGFNEQQLKDSFSGWTEMDTFKKDVEGFRAAVIKYYMNRYEQGMKEAKIIPEKLKQRDDDWGWFEQKKGKKSIQKSGELQINSYTPLSYIKRTGGLLIESRYVDQAMNKNPDQNPITKDIGFKSAQFGNSLKDSEAKEHIRHFLGAMVDISEILDIDIKQLNGIAGLSIAFAARGSGGASAHYERGRVIINITNRRGDGAVAHEFGHYFDNAVTMMGKSSLSLNYGSEIQQKISRSGRIEGISTFISNQRVSDAMLELMNFIYKGKVGITPDIYMPFTMIDMDDKVNLNGQEIKLDKVPSYYDEIKKEFAPVELLDTIDATINYLKGRTRILREMNYKYPELQAKVIGYIMKNFSKQYYEIAFSPNNNESAYFHYCSRMKSSYWIRAYELFARAWECYIFDKMQVKGRMNNYLVSGEYFDKKIPIADLGYTYVYPFGEERKYLFDLFENLVNSVKEEMNLSSFKPFVDIRQDEYLAFEGDSQSGVEVEKFEQGGQIKIGEQTGYDVTDSMLSEFNYKKESSAIHGQQTWVRRIPKKVSDSDFDFIPSGGIEEKRISGLLLYGFDSISKDQKKKIVAGLKNGLLKILEILPADKYLLIKASDMDKFQEGGLTENEFSDHTYVTVWSRPFSKELINDHLWLIERSHTIGYVYNLFETKRGQGEPIRIGNREYAWFAEGVDPNEKKKQRIDSLMYDKMVRDLNDLGKDHFESEEDFNDWWNRTTISNDSKEFVQNKLRANGLLK
jgi:hypothetical protein